MGAGLQRLQDQAPELPRDVLVGLVGAGIGLSRTPRMHEIEGARLGLRYIYKILDADRFGPTGKGIAEVLEAARLCGFRGLNVTFPFKQEILPLLDELSEDAEAIGAVNTVVFSNGKARGENTDLWGFAEGFRRNMTGAPLGTVLQIGSGGAGAAVGRALVQLGVTELLIADLDRKKSERLADHLSGQFGADKARPVDPETIDPEAFDGLVNTTPVGMAKLPGMPVSTDLVTPEIWVADIIYFPLETQLLRTARRLGCRTMSGAPMAVFQAVKAFELFSGIVPDSEKMKAVFDAFTPSTPVSDPAQGPERSLSGGAAG